MLSIVSKIKENLGHSTDIVNRKINNIEYIYLESVSSDNKISDFLNKSLVTNIDELQLNLNKYIYNSHIIKEKDYNKIYYFLASGFTLLFIDNCKEYIAIETRANIDRGVSESTFEPIIRGPKDSFTENHSINLGLIRKRIKDKELWINDYNIGKYTNTKISLCYINKLIDKKIVNKVIDTLNKIEIDGIIDSGYIKNILEKDIKSVFPQILCTERPDLACINLLHGKLIIFVENSPIALILPISLNDFFISTEDYYQKSKNAVMTRILRIMAFIVSIVTPAIYIALMTFNQEIIPNQLLISLASQRSQVPFPSFIEVLIFIIIFGILREADIRSPSIAGSSMSIVGALVLGDAAVTAGLVSPMVIIVIAITSICELVFFDIDINNSIRAWRLVFIFSTIVTGIIGIVVAFLLLIIKLASIEYMETPYLAPYSPITKKLFKDSIFVANILKRKNKKEVDNI